MWQMQYGVHGRKRVYEMDEETCIRYLRIPLYAFLYRGSYYTASVAEQAKQLLNGHSAQDRDSIIASLKWASEHPEYPYSSLLPDASLADREIYQHFHSLFQAIAQDV